MTELRQRLPRIREPKYLAWLRTRQCSACGKWPPCDAAHLRVGSMEYKKFGVTGMQEKPDDKWATPLCRSCHRRQHNHGDEIRWWGMQGCRDPFKLCLTYHSNYREETGAPEAEVQRYRKKRKRVSSTPRPKQKIRNRVGWPKRPFPKKRATK